MTPVIKPVAQKQANGLRAGDRVRTSLGRIAVIVAIRSDGYLDAKYEGWPPTLADVILKPELLVKI